MPGSGWRELKRSKLPLVDESSHDGRYSEGLIRSEVKTPCLTDGRLQGDGVEALIHDRLLRGSELAEAQSERTRWQQILGSWAEVKGVAYKLLMSSRMASIEIDDTYFGLWISIHSILKEWDPSSWAPNGPFVQLNQRANYILPSIF